MPPLGVRPSASSTSNNPRETFTTLACHRYAGTAGEEGEGGPGWGWRLEEFDGVECAARGTEKTSAGVQFKTIVTLWTEMYGLFKY